YWDKKHVDWLSQDYRGRRVHCAGFFQEPQFYENDREKVRSWLNLIPVQDRSDDIVMHIRLGDYGDREVRSILNPQYYKRALEIERYRRGSPRKLYLVCEYPQDRYIQYLSQYRPILISGSAKDDFHFLRSCGTIISSNSSYAWWAAYLSNARTVYTPRLWMRNCPWLRLQHTKGFTPIEGTFLR
ncbi:unnamed protein product, partial [marine sediment metagenome]